MKIFPLRPLSQLDKAKNLLAIMNQANKNNYDREIEILGCKMTVRELREIYKSGLKQLRADKFEK